LKADSFDEQLKRAVSFFNSINFSDTVKVVSHIDADGICAAAIMVSALAKLKRKYAISFVHQLDQKFIGILENENYGCVIFTDLGSGQISLIKQLMKAKKVLVLDHHFIIEKDAQLELPENIFHLNPHLCGINGSTDIAGAGVVFEFVCALDQKNKVFAHLAVIGAIGDCQERNGFTGRNTKILSTAESMKLISTKSGLRLFGAQSKPIHKLLEYSFDPYIPGVTGSEEGALSFLKSLNIKIRAGSTLKKLSDLTDEETKLLSDAIKEKIALEKNSSELIGNVYILPNEAEGAFRDAKEFSTVLNSCGRMGNPGMGIGVCLGDLAMKEKAISSQAEYRREIMGALQWYNSATSSVIKKKGFVIINAKYNILPTIAGTVASILSRSDNIPGGTFILAMARLKHNETKVSLRISGNHEYSKNVDLREVISRLSSKVGGTFGGHRNAAGAVIDTSKENEFIEFAQTYLSNVSMEEDISA
jgi:single-stranded-DNA-specific exonuclease